MSGKSRTAQQSVAVKPFQHRQGRPSPRWCCLSADAPSRTNDELLRYEGYNARRTLHQLRNASTCIFIGSAQLLFRIILCDVLQTEKADRKVLPPTSFQFVSSSSKTSFICAGVSSLTRFSLFKANSTMVRLVTKPLQASIPSTIFSKIFFHVAY